MAMFSLPVTSVCWELVPKIRSGHLDTKHTELIAVSTGTNIHVMIPNSRRGFIYHRSTFDCEETVLKCIFLYWVPCIVYITGSGIGRIDITEERHGHLRFEIKKLNLVQIS